MPAGLDQEGLAAAVGLSASSVSRIELGRREVRPDTLGKVLSALERPGIDLARNTRTGHHAAGTSYG